MNNRFLFHKIRSYIPVRVIYNGAQCFELPKQDQYIIRSSLAIRPTTFVIFSDTINEILDAIHLIKNLLPPWVLLLKEKPNEGFLKKAKDLGFYSKIRYSHEFSICNIAILSTKDTILPQNLLDAMACGVPVITSDTEAGGEVVIHNRCGFLTSLENPKTLSQFILRYALEEDLRKSFSMASKERIQSCFPLEYTVESYIKVLSAA